MSESFQFVIYSIIWVISFISFIYILRKSNYKNIGLGLIYFFNFSLIHFWGSVFFISPGYWNEDLEFTLIGYKYSTIAILSFFVGYVLFIKFGKRKDRVNPLNNGSYLGSEPLLYFLFGLLIFFILKPLLLGLPTVTVFVSMGQQLLIVGLCLLLYKTYKLRNFITFFSLIVFSALIPFITILNDGFLGTGLSMFITVLIFMTNFYRLNYRYIILVAFGIYLGLSFYQSYLRDREDIRELVWGGAEFTERVEQLQYTLTHVEFFNPLDSVHLDRVNERLNQNWIVGASVVHLSGGYEEYAKGDTFKQGIMNLIPRIIWKNKPIVAGDTRRVEKYTGIDFQEDTSVGMPHVMELYVNFAVYSVIIGFILIGILFSYLDYKSFITLHNYQFNKFVFYFLPALAFMRTETPFIDNISGAVAGGILAFGLQKFPKKLYGLSFLLIFSFVLILVLKKYYLPLLDPINSYLKYIIPGFILLVLFIILQNSRNKSV